MIGNFGDQVIHLPTNREGIVVMLTSGAIGIFSTPVQLSDGRIEEFPDSELRFESHRIRHKILMLRHNMIAHPVAAILWLFDFEKAGDWVHNNW